LSLVSNGRKLKQSLGVDKTAAIAKLKDDADQVKKELEMKQKLSMCHY
jgi:hypothetical protein